MTHANRNNERIMPVSYTHLDVYKRQGKKDITNNIKQVSNREFLLKEGQEVGRNHYPECPEIICKISNLLVRALIDTGSEVTCVSSKFVENSQLRNCPRLPVKHCNVPVSYTHLDVYKRQL